MQTHEPTGDRWAAHVTAFVDDHYGSLRGRVRTRVIDAQLAAHLPAPPARVVDVGGGAGNQSLPLARRGYDVTILDSSPAMLDRARALLHDQPVDVAERVRLVEADGRDALEVVGPRSAAAVLCHGVISYFADPEPLLGVLCGLCRPGGVVSVVAKNARTLATLPALEGRWQEALDAFDRDEQINALGLWTRADTVDDLSGRLRRHGVRPVAWYGVRLFTDRWTGDEPDPSEEDTVIAVELEAGRREPYRSASRLFHLVGSRDRAAVA